MITTDISKFDAYRLNLLTHKIKNVKSDYDSDITDTSEFLKGSRYKDDARIARMVLGYFFSEAGFDYDKANANFLALNSTEILPYIKKAIMESAGADYHYTYEKQY